MRKRVLPALKAPQAIIDNCNIAPPPSQLTRHSVAVSNPVGNIVKEALITSTVERAVPIPASPPPGPPVRNQFVQRMANIQPAKITHLPPVMTSIMPPAPIRSQVLGGQGAKIVPQAGPVFEIGTAVVTPPTAEQVLAANEEVPATKFVYAYKPNEPTAETPLVEMSYSFEPNEPKIISE